MAAAIAFLPRPAALRECSGCGELQLIGMSGWHAPPLDLPSDARVGGIASRRMPPVRGACDHRGRRACGRASCEWLMPIALLSVPISVLASVAGLSFSPPPRARTRLLSQPMTRRQAGPCRRECLCQRRRWRPRQVSLQVSWSSLVRSALGGSAASATSLGTADLTSGKVAAILVRVPHAVHPSLPIISRHCGSGSAFGRRAAARRRDPGDRA